MEKVLLGLIDETYNYKNDQNWETNKIGGLPIYPKYSFEPLCFECQSRLSFVCQVSCPLPKLDCSRVIYLYVCLQKIKKHENNSWQVFRVQKTLKNKIFNFPTSKSAFNDFNFNNLDWSDSSLTFRKNSVQLFQSEINRNEIHNNMKISTLFHNENKDSILKISGNEYENCPLLHENEKMSKRGTNEKLFIFKPFYINVYNEEDCLEKEKTWNHEEKLLKNYLLQEKLTISDLQKSFLTDEKEKGDEELNSKGFDCIQQKFFSKLKKCPKQIIRYNYKGSPLLLKSPDESFFSHHCSCGAPRVFEFQVMPALLNFLKSESCGQEHEIDFGCLYIYTCSANCWFDNERNFQNEGTISLSKKIKKEWVLVQEDDSLEKNSVGIINRH